MNAKLKISRQEERIAVTLGVRGDQLGSTILADLRGLAAQGMDNDGIKAWLGRAMAPGGRYFDTISGAFGGATAGAVGYISLDSAHEAWDKAHGPEADLWRWVSVSDANRCEDCEWRHGEVLTWAGWESIGLPGAGATRCGWRCRCELVPEAIAGDIGGPIGRAEIKPPAA